MINIELLKEMSSIYLKSITADDAYQAVFDILEKIIVFDSATLFIYDKNKDQLNSQYQRGDTRVELIREFEFQGGVGLSGWMTTRKEPLVLPSLVKARPGKDNLFQSFLSMPLWGGEDLIGILNLGHHSENTYDRNDIELYATIASQISMVVEKVKLQSELKEQNEVLRETLAELNQAQQELIAKERLAAIGEIVITVNHEINNPLTTIMGMSEILQLTLETLERDKIKSGLQGILKEAKRIQRVTQKLSKLNSAQATSYVGETNMILLSD